MSVDLVEVRLLSLPVQLHRRAQTHSSGLQREFDLIRQREPDESAVPHRLLALIEELTAVFASFTRGANEELDDAADRGEEAIDLAYRVPRAAGSGAQRLAALLDEADSYCRTGSHLLTLVTPPEALPYRRWFLSEFIRQARGEPPVAWTDYVDNGSSDDVPAPAQPTAGSEVELPKGWSTDRARRRITVRGPLDLVSAPPLRELLVDVLDEGGQPVTVDLEACDFIDSVGVSVIVAGVLRADERGVSLRFRLSAAAERVLHVSGMLERIAREED